MLIKNKTNGYISLIIFSIVTSLAWRLEVEFHGWEGLIWLSYFHLAIPFSFFLFILWINLFFDLPNLEERLIINSLLIFWIVIAFISITASLESLFAAGPSAIFYLTLSDSKMRLLNFVRYFFTPLFPIISLLSLRLINIKVRVLPMFLSLLIYLLSFPLAVLLLQIFSHKGEIDLLHAVKSGVVFPFLFFSLGLPLIYSFRIKKHETIRNDILDDSV